MEPGLSSDASSSWVRTLEPGEQFMLPREVAGKNSPSGWVRVHSPSRHIIGSLTVFDPAFSLLDSVSVAPIPPGAFVFPDIGSRGSARFSIGNPGDGATTLTLELRDKSGAVKSVKTHEIPANGTLEIGSLLDFFPGSSAIESDYLRGFSTGSISPFEFAGKDRKTIYTLRGLAESESGTVLLSPQYVVGAGWISQLSAVNLDSISGMVSVEFIGEDGTEIGSTQYIPIEPNGKLQIAGGDLFGIPSGEFRQGHLVIRSSGVRLAGSVIFMDAGQERFAAALPLIAHPERAQVVNHLTSSDEYFTGLSILNPGEEGTTVKMELYDARGRLEAVTVSGLKAGRRRAGLLTEFFPNLIGANQDSGYIRICSKQPVRKSRAVRCSRPLLPLRNSLPAGAIAL